MNVDTQVNGSTARLVLNGRFDFNCHGLFIQSTDPLLLNGRVDKLELDFEYVKYIDSSAMGMLLLLKERANCASKSITLVNCKGTVGQVFELMNFSRLFDIR